MTDEAREKSYKLITTDKVRIALASEQGPDADLLSWSVKDFTKKGDNYACIVTSVEVRFLKDGEERMTSFVAKLTPCREGETMKLMNEAIFNREGATFTQIIPEMNRILAKHGLPAFRAAKCHFLSLKAGEEMLLLEDLRPSGFKMFDRRRGLDLAHARLVLQQLAYFHAGSLLLEESLPSKNVLETYNLKDVFMSSEESKKMFGAIVGGQLEGTAKILQKFPKYDPVRKWIEEMRKASMSVFTSMLEPSKYKRPFHTLNHGDSWNNNILFRYDDSGAPVEVVLVDYQAVRKVSPVVDLNYLFYSSFNGPDRKAHFDELLQVYHEAFSEVVRRGGFPGPFFTLEELREEFRRRMVFGCLTGMLLTPLVLSEGEDIPDLDLASDEKVEEFTRKRQAALKRMSEKEGGLLKPRLLDMLDEMMDAGVIS